jgi:prevent-host-death family protein
MPKTVSAANANRNFSQLLRDVRDGRECVITSHGKPVARLVRLEAHRDIRAAARDVLFKRLRSQPASLRAGRWTRDELYER